MLFNSPEFAAFLGIALAAYYALGAARWRAQNVFLLVASYFFYGWWDARFLALIALSTAVDFICGLRIHEASDRRIRNRWLTVSCVVNLGVLGFFKYFDFFVESAAAALGALGFEASPWVLRVLLPPGISFYTFQTLSYTIDIHRGRLEPRRDFLSFALFVAYFPQLVAGPIERASRLLPQIERARPPVTVAAIGSGLTLILIGLFKKIAIADRIAPISDTAFADPNGASSAFLLSGIYAFALQIYCDFSAYSDIARGASRLLGIELMRNFETPYLSRNITDFWRRWHISLSTWLRDYLYIPLGGSRGGSWQTYRNLVLTMLLGGLWHGAAWTFVVWGGLHGGYLAAHRMWCARRERKRVPVIASRRQWAGALLSTAFTFHLVILTLVFFRAGMAGFDVAFDVLTGLFALRGSWDFGLEVAAALVLVLAMDALQRWTDSHAWPLELPGLAREVVIQLLLVGTVLAIAAATNDAPRPFIYFQF